MSPAGSTATGTRKVSLSKRRRRCCTGSRCIQGVALCVVIVAVWCIMMTPAILYYTGIGQNTSDQNRTGNISCQMRHNYENATFNDNNNNRHHLSNITINNDCSGDFFFSEANNECRPHCGEWSSYSQSDLIASNVVIGISMSLGIVSTIFIMVFSCVKRRNVYEFPTVMIVYQDLTIVVLGVLVLIGFIDRELLFCSSTDLRTVFEEQNTTPFCSLTGTHLALLAITVWSLVQVSWILLSLYLPQKAKMLRERGLYKHSFHVTVLLAGLLSAVIPIAVTFGTGGFSVLGTRFPPILCIAADRNAIISSLVVPLCVLLSIILTLLILVVHFLIKRSRLAACHFKTETTSTNLSSIGLAPTVKVLVVSCYYIFLGFGASLAYTVSSRSLPSLKSDLYDYFECERCGINVSYPSQLPCVRDGFEQRTNPSLETIGFSLLGIYPVFTLVYIIQCSATSKKNNCCTQ